YFGAEVKAALSVPSFYDNFDLETGEFRNEEIAAQVKSAVATLG
ncbi:NADPH-dependent FMN reductase, partial [Vibrio astriarenae]